MTLVDEHPLVQQVDGKLADLQRQRDEFEARAKKLAEDDAASQRKYDEARRSALLHGTEMPAPPVQLLQGADMEIRQSFMLEQQLLTEERRRVLAAVYDEILRKGRRQATKLVKQARPTLEKLADTMAEVGSLLAAVQTCRDAANAANPGCFRQSNDSRLTIETFIPLVATGADPTGLLDLPGARPVVPSIKDGLTRADIQQLMDGTFQQLPAESQSPDPVSEHTPARTVGFAGEKTGEAAPGQVDVPVPA